MFRVEIKPVGTLPSETFLDRVVLNRKAVEVVRKSPLHDRPLAICGGGPLLVHDLPELRQWKGDVWAINHTASWLRKQGIKATFVTVDPILYDVEPVDEALISLTCDPRLFERMPHAKGFDLFETSREMMIGGTSSATRIPSLAHHLGYRKIHFFGCEGSYEGDQTHVDRKAYEPLILIVRAGGKDYKVELALYVQCQELAAFFKTFPDIYINRSGGLVKAMMEDADWSVVAVSEGLKAMLESENGKQGWYDQRYAA